MGRRSVSHCDAARKFERFKYLKPRRGHPALVVMPTGNEGPGQGVRPPRLRNSSITFSTCAAARKGGRDTGARRAHNAFQGWMPVSLDRRASVQEWPSQPTKSDRSLLTGKRLRLWLRTETKMAGMKKEQNALRGWTPLFIARRVAPTADAVRLEP